MERDGTTSTTTNQVVRPMTSAGVQGLAAVPFPASKSLQRFKLLESWVEGPDGKRTTLDPKTIIVQASPWSMQAPTLSDIEMQVLPIPQLGLGGQLHLSAQVAQTTPHFPGNAFFVAMDLPWLQRNSSAMTINTPTGMPVFIQNNGWTAAAERKEGDRTLRRYTRTAVPFAMPDSRATSPIDWAPRLLVTTFPDWASFARAYQDRAAPKEVATPEISALAAALTRGAKSDSEKLVAITTWVRDNIRYVNIVLDVGGFVPAPASDVLDKRFGDCKGHVTLAMALLDAAGVDATPALVNAERVYEEPSVAFPAFNHVIVYASSLDVFVDTTSRFVEPGEIPSPLAGKFTLLTRSGKTMRIPITGTEPTKTTISDDLKIAADGTISGTSRTEVTGDDLRDMRATLAGLAMADRSQIVSKQLSNNGSPGTGTISALPNGKGIEGQFTLSTPLDLEAPGAMKIPATLVQGSIYDSSRSASAEPPKTTYLCLPGHQIEKSTLTFPANVAVGAVPKGMRIETPLIRYTSSYAVKGQKVEAVREYQSLYPQPNCTPDQFRAVAETKRQIARDIAAQVMFAPKEASTNSR